MRFELNRLSRLGGNVGNATQVSVVIPAFNAASYLSATLESVYAQSSQPGEIIVVDDGSTDDTVAIARSCGARIISLSNTGPSSARNAGTHAAKGEFIAYLDADDIWARDKLAVQVAALALHSQPAFSFTDFRSFDSSGLHVARSGLRNHHAFRHTAGRVRDRPLILIATDEKRPVLPDMYFLPSSVLVRRADVLAVGGFDETLRAGEDYEFFLRLFRLVPGLAVMQPLLYYRRHPEQLTASSILTLRNEFEIVSRVAAAPRRYPTADAIYIMGKGFLINYRIGVCEARLGKFDESIETLNKSLSERRSLKALGVLFAAKVARGAFGQRIIRTARAIVRKWSSRRVADSVNG